ncbi:MAG: type II secretion system F family protein [Nocardioidaceae bacterium]
MLTMTMLLVAASVHTALSPQDVALRRVKGGGVAVSWTAPRLGPALAVAVVVAALIAVSGAPVRLLVLVLAGLGTSLIVQRLVRAWRLRGLRRRRQRAAIEMCDALAAEMSGGVPAVTAIERSCAVRGEWLPVATAARLGGDIGQALRRCGSAPGAEGLAAVAAAWEVAAHSGAALAVVLERVAAALRSDDEARSEVLAALGPPRATAKMLAVLPIFGLALGASMGAHPVHFLLGTTVGLGCLALGVMLALTGVWWVERLAGQAEV